MGSPGFVAGGSSASGSGPDSRHDAGGSTVEMAILAPLLAMLLLYGVFLSELGVACVRQQEVARFLAFEATAHELSDLDRGDHARRFASASAAIGQAAALRYRDLSGHDRREGEASLLATTARLGQLELRAAGLDARADLRREGGAVGKVTRVLGRSLETALGGVQGFDVQGASVEVSVPLRVENHLFPDTGGLLVEGPWLPDRLRAVDLAPARMRLGADVFALSDGRDVHLPGGDGDGGYRMWKQVQRMHLFARARRELLGPTDAAVRAVEWLIPFRFFTEAQVVAQRYADPRHDRSRMHCTSRRKDVPPGAWRNGDGHGYGGPTPPDGMSYEKCFDTLPIQAWGTARGYDADPVYRSLRERRERFLGCPRGSTEGDCE